MLNCELKKQQIPTPIIPPNYMFKMLLGSNANFVCSNRPYNTNFYEISKTSQPNLSLVMLIGAMLIQKRVYEIHGPHQPSDPKIQSTKFNM